MSSDLRIESQGPCLVDKSVGDIDQIAPVLGYTRYNNLGNPSPFARRQ